MTTVVLPTRFGPDAEVDIDDRPTIIREILEPWLDRSGELERLRQQVEHQQRVLEAILLGCSKKDFRHTVQHFGLTVNN